MFKKSEKIIIFTYVIIGWLFSSSPLYLADAAVGDIGHWRDSVGGQIPGTSFAAFETDQEIRNDGIYTRPDDSTIELDEAGDYLIISTIRGVDSSNGRYNAQARIALTSGSGSLFTSYYTGYSRDTSEDTAWFRAVGVVIGASANAQIQVQRRRDTDAPTSGSIAGESDVQVVRINPTNYGIYAIGGTGAAYLGTTLNTVNITAVTAESDTNAIQGDTGTETITVKGDNKRYLIAWSVSGNTGGSRTQRIGQLNYDGTGQGWTQSYCYQRSSTNEYCGIGSMDILETATADRDIQVKVFRGAGVAADQGGADNNGSWVTDGNGQMIVLEMPDSLEVFHSYDSTGLQNISSSATLNAMRDVSFNDAASFTKASNTAVDVTNPADVFAWANVWTARNSVGSGLRLTAYGSITVNGVEQSTGEHGNYIRGNQGSVDTFGGSFHPAGIFTVGTAGYDLGVNMDPLSGSEAAGAATDRTQPSTVGFFSLNLDTLLPPNLTQSAYRFFANADSTDVGSALAAQDTSTTLSATGDAFRLRILIDVADAPLRPGEEDFKLQFAEQSGTCDTSFTGETYSDVTAATIIAFNDNSTPTDGASLTANANDPTHGGHTIVNQSYEELNNASVGTMIAKDQDGKWDFSLIDNGATASTTYCFRLVTSSGSQLDTYSVIPEITMASAASPQTISFSISDNSIGFGSLSSSQARYATGDGLGSISSLSYAHTMSASTNASSGYSISIAGTDMTCTSCGGSVVIDAIGSTASSSSPGNEQFGLRGFVESGNGSVVSPYNSGIQYAYDPTTTDTIFTGPGDDATTVFRVYYLGNIAPETDAGSYASTITYTVTAQF